MRRFVATSMMVFSFVLAFALPVGAQDKADPTVLRVRWVGEDDSVLKEAVLSREELQALPQESFQTKTFWTEGIHGFTGPSIASIAALGPGPTLSANVMGFDDYSAMLVADEWEGQGAILAIWFDGQYMQIREKGPYWLMFPADDNPSRLYIPEIQDKLVWHVAEIEFQVGR